MKSKSFKQMLMVANAYLDMGEVVIRAAKTFINNPKVLEAVEVADDALKTATEETLALHKESLAKAYKKIKAAEEMEEETTH